MPSKPLHIVHTESSCGWGGQEIRILSEARGLQQRGHRLSLVAPPESRIAQAAPAWGLEVVPLPIARKNLSGLMSMVRWLSRQREGIDIINTHSSTDSWLTALACKVLPDSPPLVRTRHVSSPVRRSRSSFWLYQKAVRHVVVTGEALRQQLHADNGFALDSMTSVPTGIDLDRFAPAPAGEQVRFRLQLGLPERPTLGIVATLRNWKGHAYLVRALASLQERFPDWGLVIVGDGPQRQNLEQQVAAAGLKDKVHFAGNQENVEDWFRSFDVGTLPSYGDEGVPQSIMQAMACGLPVVSTPVGGIPEAVLAGETGLLVPPRDEAALAAALACLMSDTALRQQMGAAATARAQENFGLKKMLDRMEVVFSSKVPCQ